MDITEVRIVLVDGQADQHGRLLAFASATFDDCFCVRDMKVIEGEKGLFLSMPARKLCDRCPSCHGKNELRQPYCGQCGQKLPPAEPVADKDGRLKWTADTVHPICREFRERLQAAVLDAYAARRAAVRQDVAPLLSGGTQA